jgi:hypothetical protein
MATPTVLKGPMANSRNPAAALPMIATACHPRDSNGVGSYQFFQGY